MREKEKEKKPLPPDMRKVAEYIVRGQKRRSKTVFTREGSRFDRAAFDAVNAAIRALGADIEDKNVRSDLHRKILMSVTDRTPYRYLGECFCSEQKFYRYRSEVLERVLEELKMG